MLMKKTDFNPRESCQCYKQDKLLTFLKRKNQPDMKKKKSRFSCDIWQDINIKWD